MRASRLLMALCLPILVAADVPGWPDLSSPPAGAGGGSLDAAVLIGIEDYAFASDVAGARKNVQDWQAWLMGTRRVPAGSIVKRLDADAVDTTIRAALRDGVARVKPGGTLWVVYVGHGAPSRDGRDGLLVGADARDTPEGIYTRSVARSEVLAALADGPQAHTVLVMDACFSGQGVDGSSLVAERLAPLRPDPDAAPPAGVTTLYATSPDEFAGLLPGLGRPAFSYLILGALRGWGDADRDGAVTAAEATDYAAGALNVVVSGRTQRPVLVGPDLVLAKGKESGPDLLRMSLAADATAGRGTATGGAGAEATARLGGGAVDFQALAAQAEALRVAREAAERDLAAAEAELQAERRRQIDAKKAEVLRAAERDLAAIEPLVSSPSPEARPALEAWLARYGRIAVTSSDGQLTETVKVPGLDDVTQALREAKKAPAPAKPAPTPKVETAETDIPKKTDLVWMGPLKEDAERGGWVRTYDEWDHVSPPLVLTRAEVRDLARGVSDVCAKKVSTLGWQNALTPFLYGSALAILGGAAVAGLAESEAVVVAGGATAAGGVATLMVLPLVYPKDRATWDEVVGCAARAPAPSGTERDR